MKEKMTSVERIQAAIDIQKTDRTPTMLTLSHFPARYHQVPIADCLNNPELSMELKLKTFKELGGSDLFALRPPSIGFSPEAFMSLPVKVKMPGTDLPADTIPQYEETEVMLAEDYPLLIEKGWKRFAREILVPRVFPTGAKAAAEFYDNSENRRYYTDRNIALMPGNMILLPFEILSFARSFEKFFIDLYRRPEMVKAAMEVMLPEVLESAMAGINGSGRTVNVPANRQSCGFISPKFFEKFAFPQMLKVVEAMAERNVTVFFHMDQNWTNNLPYFQQFPKGRYLFHFDGMTDIYEAKRLLGDRMCLMGDVPARLLRLGTPEAVGDYCRRLIDEVGRGGGFILAAG